MLEHIKIRIINLFFAFFIGTTIINAQFNVKIAYELDYFSSNQNTYITDVFNQQNKFLEDAKELSPLHYMNGISIGATYRTRFSRVELGWHTSSRSKEAFGEKPAIGSNPAESFEVDMRYSIRGFQIGYEFIAKRVGIGATLTRDNFRLTSNIINSTNDKLITSQINYATSIHLSYQLYQSRRIALNIRPFYKIFLDEVDHSSIAQFLGVNAPSPLLDMPSSFGFSLIFYNGQQKKYVRK